MDPVMFWILVVMFWILVVPSYYGYKSYEKKTLIPRKRMKKLETVAYKTAQHNVEYMLQSESGDTKNQAVIKKGFSISKTLQETFGLVRELPEYLSLSDVLKQDHDVNKEINSVFPAYKKEAFHYGPYAHELSAQEWEFVQKSYKESMQKLLNNKINVEAKMRTLESFENNVKKELSEYIQARKELAKDPFADDFDQLTKDD